MKRIANQHFFKQHGVMMPKSQMWISSPFKSNSQSSGSSLFLLFQSRKQSNATGQEPAAADTTLATDKGTNTGEEQKKSGETATYDEANRKPIVTIFGGSGYVGRALVRKIMKDCSAIHIACRYPENFQRTFSPNAEESSLLQQIVTTHSIDVGKEREKVHHLCEGSDVVINLVGHIHEHENLYYETFVEGSKFIAHACHKYDVQRLIKLSCLGANPDDESLYLDYVFRGEDITYAAYPDATILKSSLIFGPPGSYWFDKMVKYCRLLPFNVVPPSKGKYQPVYVGDVADAIKYCIFNEEETDGKTFELGGPDVFNLKQFIKELQECTKGSSKATITLPKLLMESFVAVRQFFPEPMISRDHYPMIDADMSVSETNYFENEPVLTLKDLNIQPSSMREVLPKYYKQ